MSLSTETILKILEYAEGYDSDSRFTKRMAKKLSKDPSVQHFVNRLHLEICNKIEDKGPKIMSHSHPNKSRSLKNKRNAQEKQSLQNLPILYVQFRVANLTAGKQFSEKIMTLDELAGELEICNVQKGTELDRLSVNHSTFMIDGTIQESGDFEIELNCHLLLPSGGKQGVRGKVKISVIPNPRSLWKDLPSDKTARFHKPDTASDSFISKTVNSIAASVRGRSHAHKGTHRDDDIKIYSPSGSGWSVICVADGAGSCKYSRKGAELAVLRSTNTLRETLNGHYGIELEKIFNLPSNDSGDDEELKSKLGSIYQHTIVKAVYDAALAIQAESDHNDEDSFKDFSTTLLLAAHKPVADGHLILSFWIGDGGAVIYQKGSAVKLLGEPDSGEYAGQTRFLDNKLFGDASIYGRIRAHKVDSMTALILATDGITDAKFETEHQLSKVECWDDLWSELEPIVRNEDIKQGEKDLLEWMGFWSAGNHDDRSIAICYVKE